MFMRVINLCGVVLLFLLNSGPITAHLVLPVLEDEKKEELSKKDKLIHWVHNRHSPKHLGFDDPHLPAVVKFRPFLIPLPEIMSFQKNLLFAKTL